MTYREQIGAICSPAFETTYPEIHNRERIPLPIAAAMEAVWQKDRYAADTIRVFRFSEVYAVSQGLLLDQNLRPIAESITQQSSVEIDHAIDEVKYHVEQDAITVVENDAMVLTRLGWANYGHWLIDVLPQVFFLSEACADIAPTIYLSQTGSGALSAMHRASLGMIGVSDERIADYDFRPRLFKSLFLVVGHSRHGPFMSPAVFDMLDRLEDLVPVRASAERRRFFVDRGGAHSRSIANEAEVRQLLDHRGFEVVVPGTMTLAEQIATFREAAFTIGVAGAALTNICWQRPGTVCLGLYPSGMQDTFFWWIAQHRRLHFADVRANTAAHDLQNGEITVDVAQLDRLITKLEANRLKASCATRGTRFAASIAEWRKRILRVVK